MDYFESSMDKEQKMKDIIKHREQYLTLEQQFNIEINAYIKKASHGRYRYCACNWLKS
jgi:hypothetical protein